MALSDIEVRFKVGRKDLDAVLRILALAEGSKCRGMTSADRLSAIKEVAVDLANSIIESPEVVP